MSAVNLHEFNHLSKRHNYFMTNNRENGFPSLNKNSIFLRKILTNKEPNSIEKPIRYTEIKPRKFVRFTKPENISYKENYQTPIIVRKVKNNTNNNRIMNQGYQKTFYNSDIKNNISPYRFNPKITLDKNIIESNCYKIPINVYNRNANSIDFYNPHSRVFSNSSNLLNDSEKRMRVLSFKGRKIFTSNSFYGLNNETFNSPIKNERNNINKETELFRNTEELKKKREEIYQRKMKRESSAIKREIFKKEKDKDIKEKRIDIQFNRKNTSSCKTDNEKPLNQKKMKILPLSQKLINNNKKKINNRFKSNESNITNQSSQINPLNIKSRNQSSLFSSSQLNNRRRLINYKNRTTHFPNLSEVNANNNTLDKDASLVNNNNNNNLYYKKNIYISNNIQNSPVKNNRNYNINNKIKENLDYLRKSKNAEIELDTNANEQKSKTNSKIYSNDRHNRPYRFITKKKFVEDFTRPNLTIYSHDKKVSIRVHTLQNINESFLGKSNTKDKLKMQRVISIDFKNNHKNIKYFKNNTLSQKIKELKPLTSIKEEEEKSRREQPKSKLIKVETNMEKKERPFNQNKIRARYLRRSEK